MSPKVTQGYIDDKKRQILRGAADVFQSKGFSAATMQDIVDACGISRGGLYLFFNSTEEIFMALMSGNAGGGEDAEAPPATPGQSAVEALRAFLDAQCATMLDIRNTLLPSAYEFFIRMKDRPDVRALLAMRRNAAIGELDGMLQNGAARGEFNAEAAHGLAGFIVSFLEGLIIQSISIGMNEDALREQTRLMMEFVQIKLVAG